MEGNRAKRDIFIGFNLIFFPQFILGYLGCHAGTGNIRPNSRY
jgi:hypothetical protein